MINNLVSENSILRRLPMEMSEEQALFFDGMRHAAEIADLAHQRLTVTLTKIGMNELGLSNFDDNDVTAAYLDAWAIVDAIDRFRALYRSAPGTEPDVAHAGMPSFWEATKPIRELRNVPDHLHARIPEVIAKKGTALGELSWFTLIDEIAGTGVYCMIVPGHVKSAAGNRVHLPFGRQIHVPSGHIVLTAARRTANLSEAFDLLKTRVEYIEVALQNGIDAMALSGKTRGSDLLLRLGLSWPVEAKMNSD